MIDVDIIDHAPKVWVAGVTTPQNDAIREYLNYRGVKWNQQGVDYSGKPALIAEAAGRVCYQSWHNPSGRSTFEYLDEQIVGHNHESVIEHIWVNLMVADLPRSTQLELVRHRVGVAYSFESTRFTDKHMRMVMPPAVRQSSYVAQKKWAESVGRAVDDYRYLVQRIETSGTSGTLGRKRAKEAARSLLPNCQGSDGMVSMNMRSARLIMKRRSDEHADLSIREFAVAVYDAIQPIVPEVFGDLAKIDIVDPWGIPVIGTGLAA